jgi:4-amino-4-deoxy-L-arabinose transferase-like glycosyltransferase
MLVAALVVRLLVLTVTGAYHISAEREHFAFGGEMGRIARAVVLGQGFSSPLHGQSGPTAMVGPVYPLLVAAVFKVFGIYTATSAWVILALNSLFSALTCLPVAALGDRLFGRRVGYLAGWTWVFYPYAIYWPIRWVWDTSLSCLLLTLLLLATVSLRDSPRISLWMGFGFLWALAVLTNTTLLSLFPLTLAWLCYHVHRGRWIPLAMTSVLAFAVGIAPWMAHNHAVFGRLVLRSNLGLELYQGNYPGASGLRAWQFDPAFNKVEMEKYRQMGELPYMDEKQREAWRFITSHPGAFAVLTLRRFVYFWTGTSEIVLANYLLPSLTVYSLVTVLAIIGLVRAIRNGVHGAWLMAGVLIVYPVPYYVTHPEPRFRHLIEPEMIVLTVYALAALPARMGAWFPAAGGHPGAGQRPGRLLAEEQDYQQPNQQRVSRV